MDESADKPIIISTSVDFSKIKKKKKKKTLTTLSTNCQLLEFEEGNEPWIGTERDYTYPEMLARIYNTLIRENPNLQTGKRRQKVVPPNVTRETTKKTAFNNIKDVCLSINRPMDHLIQFLCAELGTTGSTDHNQRFIIKGRFQPIQIESVLKQYILLYVSCKTCKSLKSELFKDNRLFFIKCESCGSTSTVAAIKSGFKAQVGRRIVAG